MSQLPPDETERRQAEARARFEESIGHVKPDDVQRAAEAGQQQVRRLEQSIPRALANLWDDLKLLVAMLRDHVSGTYRQVPFGTIAAVAAALLYFVSPIDVIPDVIPGIGFIDDAAVLTMCLKMIEQDLLKYRGWKRGDDSA